MSGKIFSCEDCQLLQLKPAHISFTITTKGYTFPFKWVQLCRIPTASMLNLIFYGFASFLRFKPSVADSTIRSLYDYLK